MAVLRPYQQGLYESLKAKIEQADVSCLAGCTGAGKTEIAIQLMADNPDKRFLVLTHGLTVLRSNFYDRIRQHSELRKHALECTFRTSHDILNNARIVVALPHAIHRRLDCLESFDFIIVDEAHEYWISNARHSSKDLKMYPAIQAWHKGKFILLTATHYGIPNRETKVFFSRQDGFEKEAIQDIPIIREAVDFSVADGDFTQDGDLRDSVQDIPTPLAALEPYLSPENFPLIISTRSIAQASTLKALLEERGALKGRVALSQSVDDPESKEVEAFRAGQFDVCVVVNRCQLGFDYPRLETFIDATYTQNVKRIEQMVGRVTRRHPGAKNKKYVKLIPAHMSDDYKLILVAVIALGERETYQNWDGFNRTLRIKVARGSSGGDMEGSADSKERKKIQPVKGIETFKDYLEIMTDDTVESVTLYQGLLECRRIRLNGHASPWLYCETIEQWAEFVRALGVQSQREWHVQHHASEAQARKKGVLKEVIKHLGWQHNEQNSLLKQQQIRDFVKENGRFPDKNSPDKKERILRSALSNYCSRPNRHPEFVKWVRDNGFGDLSERTQREIKDFYDINGRLPQRSSEPKLYGKMAIYCQKSRYSYDPELDAWLRRHGYGGGNSAIGNKTKTEIKEFFRENNRLPGIGTLDNYEKRLYTALAAFTSKGKTFDPEFNTWARARGHGKRQEISLERSKQMIKDFYIAHGRLPTETDDKALYGRLRSYCKENRSAFDAEFAEWARQCGYGISRAVHSKKRIKDFFDREGRLPSHTGEERNLYSRMTSYCSKTRKSYDPEFEAWAVERGYGKGRRQSRPASSPSDQQQENISA